MALAAHGRVAGTVNAGTVYAQRGELLSSASSAEARGRGSATRPASASADAGAQGGAEGGSPAVSAAATLSGLEARIMARIAAVISPEHQEASASAEAARAARPPPARAPSGGDDMYRQVAAELRPRGSAGARAGAGSRPSTAKK